MMSLKHRANFQLEETRSVTNSRSGALDLLPRPPWLQEAHWPFTTYSVEVEDRHIAVTDVGRGPVLLFVHTGFWSFIWRDLIQRLTSEYRCVTFDSPGTGLSERLPLHQISLAKAARAVAAVIEKLDLRELTLVIHDLGGPVGIAGAAETPERIGAVAALNTFAWRPSDLRLRLMLNVVGSVPARELDVLFNALPRITASNFGIGLHLDSDDRRIFELGIGRDGLRAFHQYMADALKARALYDKAAAMLSGPLRKLPLTTIFGERNDPFGFQERWKKLFPGARQFVINKGNHFPMCDDPAFVAEALRSLHTEKRLLAFEQVEENEIHSCTHPNERHSAACQF